LTPSGRSHRFAATLGVLLLAAPALAGCGGFSTSSTGSGGTITLYNAQHEQLTNALVAAFTKQTGINVRVRSGEEPELANQLVEEGSASPADVFLTENSPPLVLLSEKGLLARLPASTLASIPARYDSPVGDWVGLAARATALIYNPKLLPAAQLPRSILDLADPSWKGKLALAPAEVDFQPVVAAVAKLDGAAAAKRWLSGFASNAKRYNDNEGIVAAVEAGQAAAGIVNHYYWYRAADEIGLGNIHSKLYYFGHNDPGALVDVCGAAVLKSSRQSALAQKFVAFLASKQGQQALVRSGDWEYPLLAGVAPRAGLKPFATLDPPSIGPSDLGDDRSALRLMQQAGLL
jgi:iron(III) transport system substrate-binding protein